MYKYIYYLIIIDFNEMILQLAENRRHFGVIFSMTTVIAANIKLGNHVPNIGGKPPETEKTVEICWRKMKVNASPMPMKMCTPTPLLDLRHDTLTPSNVIIIIPNGLANRLCCSIW